MRAIVKIRDDFPPHRILAELTTAHDVDRLMALHGPGDFAFAIATNDGQASRDTVREGRIVTIESTTGLPAYIGRILRMEEDTGRGRIEVSGDGIPQILYERSLPLDLVLNEQAAGTIAMHLLSLVNSTNPTSIWPSTRGEPGTPLRGSFQAGASSLGEMLDEMAALTGDEWWVESVLDQRQMQNFLRWGRRRGTDKSYAIHLQEGIHLSASEYARDALGFAQSVTVIGGGGDLADRPAGLSTFDTPSAFQRKGTVVERASEAHVRSLTLSPALARETVEVRPLDEDESILQGAAQRLMEIPTTAAETLRLTVNDRVSWSLYGPGDHLRVILASVNFGGISRRVRVLAVQPDEDAGEQELIVKVEEVV
jgi:hypothetical protein